MAREVSPQPHCPGDWAVEPVVVPGGKVQHALVQTTLRPEAVIYEEAVTKGKDHPRSKSHYQAEDM